MYCVFLFCELSGAEDSLVVNNNVVVVVLMLLVLCWDCEVVISRGE